MANRLNQWRASKKYAAKLNLLNKIHKQVDPELEKQREALDFAENRRFSENQGFVFDLSKYINEGYSMGRETEPNLAFENDSRFALVIHAQKMKEEQVKEARQLA